MEPADGEPEGESAFAPAKARWCIAREILIDEEPRSIRRVALFVLQRFSMIVRDLTVRPCNIDPRGTSVPSQERRPTLPQAPRPQAPGSSFIGSCLTSIHRAAKDSRLQLPEKLVILRNMSPVFVGRRPLHSPIRFPYPTATSLAFD